MYRCEVQNASGEWVYATSYKTERGALRWLMAVAPGMRARMVKSAAETCGGTRYDPCEGGDGA